MLQVHEGVCLCFSRLLSGKLETAQLLVKRDSRSIKSSPFFAACGKKGYF